MDSLGNDHIKINEDTDFNSGQMGLSIMVMDQPGKVLVTSSEG